MKKNKTVVVFDTNCLISAALIADSVNEKALNKILVKSVLAFSEETFSEFVSVLYRPKFDKYLSDARRAQLIDRIERKSKRFITKEVFHYCRDPKDNMFLELAVAARATCIVTGDKALLELHPFRNIPILSPSDFVHANWI